MRIAQLAHDGVEAPDDVRPSRVAQPEHEHPSDRTAGRSGDLTEVQIESQYDALVGKSAGEDLTIGERLPSLLAEMHHVVTAASQPIANPHIDTCIDEKAHDCRAPSLQYPSIRSFAWTSSRKPSRS